MTEHREYSDDGILLIEGSYDKKGSKIGLWREYNSHGILLAEEYYQKGNRHGKYISYHDNGSVWCRGTFKNGLKDGEFKTFDRDNKLMLTQIYFKDELFSEYKSSCNNK